MNKNLANDYQFDKSWNEDGSYDIYPLKAHRNGRYYQTKMRVSDLPEHYCVVNRFNAWSESVFDVITVNGIKDIKYYCVEENHFMKDSVLRISFNGEIKEEHEIINGKESWIKNYTNVDEMVFGNSVFIYLSYVKHLTDYDISDIREEFIKQCKWLKENEPNFVPDTNDYGEWFDNTLDECFKNTIEKRKEY